MTNQQQVSDAMIEDAMIEFERLILPAFSFLKCRGERDLALRIVQISTDFDKAMETAR